MAPPPSPWGSLAQPGGRVLTERRQRQRPLIRPHSVEPGRPGTAPSAPPPGGAGLELPGASSCPPSSPVCFLQSGPRIGRRVEEKFCRPVSISEEREFPIHELPLSKNQWKCVYQKLDLAWAGREWYKPLEGDRKGRGKAQSRASALKQFRPPRPRENAVLPR